MDIPASVFATPVLTPSRQAPRQRTALFRAAKWVTGIVARSLAAAVGFMLGIATAASTAAEKEPSAPETIPSFVYFPSQYVNTATEIDELPAQF